VLAVVASLWAVMARPDVLISGEGQAAAIRGADGRLSVLHSGRDTFATREWLAADGNERTVKDASLNAGVRCDEIGCIGHLADGRLVSMALAPEAFLEDCARAAVVISAREAPGGCSGAAGRPQCVAQPGRDCPAMGRRSIRDERGASAWL
jgi:competence protein ComEC